MTVLTMRRASTSRSGTSAARRRPRASQALTLCARARALYDGRLAPSIDDIKALAEPVLQHRMALTFAARAEGMSVRDVVARLVKGI